MDFGGGLSACLYVPYKTLVPYSRSRGKPDNDVGLPRLRISDYRLQFLEERLGVNQNEYFSPS